MSHDVPAGAPDHRARRARYLAFDGIQDPMTWRIDVRDALERMSDEVLQGFGVRSALQRLLEQGMDGVRGLDELRRQLAERRRRTSTGPAERLLRELGEQLEEIIDLERAARIEEGDEFGAMELGLLPDDPANRFQALLDTDFASDEAAQRFERLRQQVGQELLDAQFSQLAAGIASVTPDDLAAFREMLADLNELIDQRDRGEEPDLDGFLDRHGQFFPDRPETLDELLAQLAQRMAAASRMMASLPEDQRRQLRQLMDSVLDDPDLQLEMLQLEANLRELMPNLPWDQGGLGQGEGQGFGEEGFGSMSALLDEVERLGELEQLDEQLAGRHPGATLDDVDEEALARALGEDAVRDLRRLKEIERTLEESGALTRHDGELELSPRGARLLGQQALTDLLKRVPRETARRQVGADREPTGQSRPWAFGDTEPLDVVRTVRNSVTRQAGEGWQVGDASGLRLHPDDLEVVEHEVRPRTATALLLDLSFSMVLQGHLVPAKRMALALHALITGQHRQDSLHLIGFSDYARRIQPEDLASLGIERVYGTNMQHAFLLARRLLQDDPRPHKQVIMVTDGEPTAHLVDGTSWFNWPPIPETLETTLREAMRLARSQISLDVFLLEDSHGLVQFAERLSGLTGGEVTHLQGDALGRHIVTGYAGD